MAVITEEEVIRRVESPMNLFNRLRSTTKKDTQIVSIPAPKSDELIPNLDDKIGVMNSKSKALLVMNKVLTRLDSEIECIESKKLPSVVRDMASAIRALEPESTEKSNNVQFVIYQPTMMKETDYGAVIEAKDG
jgi:hypothetical protein